jgi:hypothetical protein
MQVYADLGYINHWQPSEMDAMDWADLVIFHEVAWGYYKATNGVKD